MREHLSNLAYLAVHGTYVAVRVAFYAATDAQTAKRWVKEVATIREWLGVIR